GEPAGKVYRIGIEASHEWSRVGPLQAIAVAGDFFFQAEDGIRDKLVTGVQTCALPISLERQPVEDPVGRFPKPRIARAIGRDVRSEERRVGKECRSRWSRYQ